ncbi:DUF1643 domain-containing protein [Mycolicibacterium fortuitum]|uniref:DUF1643 domain-containing protein n=1 Tax=Mycolicibacterium fortuitum TaxID=1766 RepID=UPI003AAA7AB0
MTLTLDLHLAHNVSSAVFSEDRRYRYELSRRWGPGPALMFVSLNPSDADEHRDDPTTRRDVRFARGFGYDAVTLLNLNAGRTPNPAELAGMDDPIGPDNDAHLDRAAAAHDVIVFAWGANADPDRATAVATRLWNIARGRGGSVAVLGWTADGQPRHPLYLRGDTPLQCLTADAHTDMLDVDPRWTQLLADTDVLDALDGAGSL